MTKGKLSVDVEPYKAPPRTRRKRQRRQRPKLPNLEKVADSPTVPGQVSAALVFYGVGWDEMERWLARTNSLLVRHKHERGTDYIHATVISPNQEVLESIRGLWWAKDMKVF